jgi:hypothetical protein
METEGKWRFNIYLWRILLPANVWISVDANIGKYFARNIGKELRLYTYSVEDKMVECKQKWLDHLS